MSSHRTALPPTAWLGLDNESPRGRHPGKLRPGAGPSLAARVRTELGALLLDTKMTALLLLMPFALAASAVRWPAGVVFVLALLPLCSLAERLGFITEQLALYTNDTLGGLLNATFGNATEVIIAAFAIKQSYLRVVKLTLLGSVVSNLLLVMGSAFLAGGLLHSSQRINQQGISVNCGLLIVAVIAIMLPTLLSESLPTHVAPGLAALAADDDALDAVMLAANGTAVDGGGAVGDATAGELALSRFEAVLMLLAYVLFLVFQLCTHRHLFEDSPDEEEGGRSPSPARASSCTPSTVLASNGDAGGATNGAAPAVVRRDRRPSSPRSGVEMAALGGGEGGGGVRRDDSEEGLLVAVGRGDAGESQRLVRGSSDRDPKGVRDSEDSEEEEEDERVLSLPSCFLWLAVVTVLISLLSDIIMQVIKDASLQLGVPLPFLTTIVVPLVGNAAEHSSAVVFAMKNRMEIALGVAVGSSTQIAVLVVPFCVLLAWAMGRPLDLNFANFEALVLFVSVLLAIVVVQDGTANWLKGAMLILTYFFVAASFWVHKDPELTEAAGV